MKLSSYTNQLLPDERMYVRQEVKKSESDWPFIVLPYNKRRHHARFSIYLHTCEVQVDNVCTCTCAAKTVYKVKGAGLCSYISKSRLQACTSTHSTATAAQRIGS